MYKYQPALVLFASIVGCATAPPQWMTPVALVRHIEELAESASATANVVEFRFAGVDIACVYDADHDRMRLVAPIARLDTLGAAQLGLLLTANFHTALDGRYAVSDGVVFAAFLHPLSSLTRGELESAMRQVAALTRNFGGSYSSDELIFGAQPAGQET